MPSSSTATVTITVSTSTPTVRPFVPLQTPAGWQVYRSAHFTMAYPPNWTVQVQPQGGSTTSQPIISYGFSSPDGKGAVSVLEYDNVDAQAIQNVYCKNTSTDQIVTFEGVQMRYFQHTDGQLIRDWVFITNHETVYQLQANDDYAGSLAVKNQDTEILETFNPQYATPGCN